MINIFIFWNKKVIENYMNFMFKFVMNWMIYLYKFYMLRRFEKHFWFGLIDPTDFWQIVYKLEK